MAGMNNTTQRDRMRRLRLKPAMRTLVAENRLDARDFIYPVFVKEGLNEPTPVKSMPGVVVQSEHSLPRLLDKAREAGVSSFLLFGIPSEKDNEATQAWAEEGIVQRALASARSH